MGDPKGFMKYAREGPKRKPIELRVLDWKEMYEPISEDKLKGQGARCMDCGVPFCQGHTGCPVVNLIPEWNDLVYRGRWNDALKALHTTNNFPEFTGRLCPAPCEGACVLGINEDPVSIRIIEWNIVDRGFNEGFVTPILPVVKTGKTVAIVGSGPAGLAAAQQLARAGHEVTVFEKSDRIGGLLRYGIPDFKMEKHLINRRAVQMEAEGVQFRTSSEVGVEVSFQALRDNFDAVVLAGGAEEARCLAIPGAELPGVRLAMEFLTQQNKRNAGDDEVRAAPRGTLSAKGKHVVVIGSPGLVTGLHSLWITHMLGRPMPATWHVLQIGERRLLVRRVDARTLEVSTVGAAMHDQPQETLFRPPPEALHAGDEVDAGSFRAKVVNERQGGGVVAVRFTFDRTLEDPSLVFLAGGPEGLAPFTLPAVGKAVAVAAPVLPGQRREDR